VRSVRFASIAAGFALGSAAVDLAMGLYEPVLPMLCVAFLAGVAACAGYKMRSDSDWTDD
jgi:hypothetical protein